MVLSEMGRGVASPQFQNLTLAALLRINYNVIKGGETRRPFKRRLSNLDKTASGSKAVVLEML